MRRLIRLWRLPGFARRALFEAVVNLALARALIVLLPFRRYAGRLGVQHNESPALPLTDSEAEQARLVQWAIATAARNVPWNAVCLPQAIAGKWMLRRRGLASTLYLGLKKGDSSMEAHAWLRAGETIVTGGADSPQRFVEVSRFS